MNGSARGALIGAIAGAAITTLPASAGVFAAALGVVLGGAIGWRFADRQPGFSPWSLALLAFFVPAITLPVAPGADMAMHAALSRGLLDGVLSPAWPGVNAAEYPRGFSALISLLSPLGLERAGLIASGASYAVFSAGLCAVLSGPLRSPAPQAVSAVAVLLSRTPQVFFRWGGNPTALALGVSLFGAAQESPRVGALCLAGAAAIHPMGACAGALVLALRWRRRGLVLAAAGGLCAVLGTLAVWGPRLSPREIAWIRAYAGREEQVSFAVLGDPANVATGLAVAWLLWRRQFRAVGLAAGAVAGLVALFALLPRAGLYPQRFGPLLLLAVAPLWARAAAARIPALAPVALLAAMAGHVPWYQRAEPLATRADVTAIRCLARQTAPGAIVDGAYGDATQWIPALAGRPVTRPHVHVSLFDELDAVLAQLPPPAWRFVGDQVLYGTREARPPASEALCGGHLYRLR